MRDGANSAGSRFYFDSRQGQSFFPVTVNQRYYFLPLFTTGFPMATWPAFWSMWLRRWI
jgi:hypothetical protein